MRIALLLIIAAAPVLAADPPKRSAGVTAIAASPSKSKNAELRRELLRRFQTDQDARKAILALTQRNPRLSVDQLEKSDLPEVKRLVEVDRTNTPRMKEIVQKYGWPGKSLVGGDGAHAAWLLVQHADRDRPFQKQCLALITEAYKQGEAAGDDLAYLTDRVLVGENKQQIYGTQFRETRGKFKPLPIEDEAHVDERRKAVGLPPLREYLEFAEKVYQQAPTNAH